MECAVWRKGVRALKLLCVESYTVYEAAPAAAGASAGAASTPDPSPQRAAPAAWPSSAHTLTRK